MMNKKERAALEAALTVGALRWTPEVLPDVMPPDSFGELSKGWIANQYGAEKACSSSVYNGHGWEKTNSQGSRSLYSMPILALKAYRNKQEREFANALRRIDKMIEKLSEQKE